MTIKVLMYERPSVRLQTFYEVTTESTSQVHVQAEVTLCFMDADTRRPRRGPAELLSHFDKS